MKKIFILFFLLPTFISIYAQDARELLYNFEILKPDHADKPKIQGFAKKMQYF